MSEMSLHWGRVSPSSSMTGVLKVGGKFGFRARGTQEACCVAKEAETGVMNLQVKG